MVLGAPFSPQPAIVVAALVGLAVVLPAQADHGCNGIVTQIDAGSYTLYLDDRSTRVDDRNHWVYLELNGVEGLQSGGYIDYVGETGLPSFPDPCKHSDPDYRIVTSKNPW